MKRFYLLFFMLASFATYAQLDTPVAYQVYEGYNLWNKQTGDTAYVFADVAYRSGQTYKERKLLPNMGLEGIQFIHRVGFHGEACGIPTTHYYLGWNGQNFVDMFSKSSVSDAGVSYYEEKILFPSEHNLDHTLIVKDIVEGEVIDYEAEDLQYSEIRRREKYLWDGKHISQILEMTPIDAE